MTDASRQVARRLRGEEGASLILAMTFLLLFSLILVALLAYAVTSFGAAGDVGDRQRMAYAANAAIDSAVQRIQESPDMHLGSSTLDATHECNLTYHPSDGTPDASATCNPHNNDAGEPTGTVRPGMDGFPANALLTTTGGITASGPGTLKSNSNVYSDGGITLNNGATLDAYDNAITARQGCTPTVPGSQWVTVKAQCNVLPASVPQYNDGNLPSGYTSQITAQPLPLNKGPTCVNGIATFGVATATPGVYSGYWTDSKKLTNNPCPVAGVFYFQPGFYYFNLSSRSGDIWHINGMVVGGTPPPGGWYSTGSVPPPPGPNATQSAACDNTGSQRGVQFVFGNDTQIYLDAPQSPNTTGLSSLELCPSTDAQGNRIAMYGALTCDTCNSDPIVGVLNPSNSGANGNADYADNAADGCTRGGYGINAAYCLLPQPPPPSGSDPTSSGIDGKAATSTSTKKTATERFDGFDWSANGLGVPTANQPQFPAGLKIQSIRIIVRHREPDTAETEQITVSALTKSGNNTTCTATPTQGTAAPGTWYYEGKTLAFDPPPGVPAPAWTPPGTDVDPNPQGLDCTGALKGAITSTKGGGQDFAKSLTVDYQASISSGNLNAARAPQLDGLQVVVTLVPQIVPQGGCVTGDAANGFSPCSFLVNNAGAAGHLGMWGTVYTPNAFIGIPGSSFDFGRASDGTSSIVFNRGVIVASLDVTGLPTDDNKGRFRLGNGTGRTVELISDPSGPVRVRALVRVVDSASAPGFLAVVRQWSTAGP